MAIALTVGGISACSTAEQHASTRATASALSAPVLSAPDAIARATKAVSGYRSVTIHATVNLNGGITLTGRVGWPTMAADLKEHLAALGTMRTLIVGSVMYQNYPETTGAVVDGKNWVSNDLAATGPGKNSKNSQAAAIAAGYPVTGRDPLVQLKLLTVATGVKRLGVESVDGVPATHYRGALASSDGDAGTLDAWIGRDNLPVRVIRSVRSGQDVFSDRTDYSGYSLDTLTVTPPPARETIDSKAIGTLG